MFDLTEVYFTNIPNITEEQILRLSKNVSCLRQEKIKSCTKLEKRKQYLCAGLLLNKVLTEKYNLKKEQLSFSVNSKGKPCFTTDIGLNFSISHCKGAVVVAVSEGNVGVDIEYWKHEHKNISQRFFCEGEKEYLSNQNNVKAFFEIWTRKEAGAKFFGENLISVLKNFDTTKQHSDCLLSTFYEDRYIISVCSSTDCNSNVQKIDLIY